MVHEISDNERDDEIKAEYEYLLNMDDMPEIPDEIYEKFEDVLEAFKNYASKAQLPEDQLESECELVTKAFKFAYKAHRNQKRKNGQMYIVHPIATAQILTDLEVDSQSLAAAFLHDTVEDTVADADMIETIFGSDIRILVQGVTKLGKLNYVSKEQEQAENTRKMLIAMNQDIRVILVKLADRLHNMRTMQYQTPAKQVEKAQETLDIFVPFAERFGVFKIKWELEDLCLRYMDHDGYYELVGLIASKRSEREAFMATVVSELSSKLEECGITHYELEGRPKHFYSIYKKMHNKGKTIDQIYDMFACRIIVENLTDCYSILGIVHSMYTPLEGRFKDYIGNPKENGYQSIHTTVKRPGGKAFGETTFEVQIRTYAMHKNAEYGIAAHWHYKESGNSKSFKEDVYDKRIGWVRQFIENNKDTEDPTEFMDLLKSDMATEEVFVFTPKGKIVRLPEGSCPIDFAYAIHSGIGNHMHGAKVNGKIVPLTYVLQNSDSVEILSSDKIKGPSKDWIKIVKTASARSKINAWFKKESRPENIIDGKKLLEREIESNGFNVSTFITEKGKDTILRKFSFKTMDDLYAAIGYGTLSAGKIFGKLRDEYIKTLSLEEREAIGYRTTTDGQVIFYSPEEMPTDLGKGEQSKTNKVLTAPKGTTAMPIPPRNQPKPVDKKALEQKKSEKIQNSIVVDGLDSLAVKLATCCHPMPSDEIVGYVTQGEGVSIHRTTCNNVLNLMKYADRSDKDRERSERLVPAKWADTVKSGIFDVAIEITASDRTGLLMDILSAIKEEHVNVDKINSRTSADFIAEIDVTVTVKSLEQCDRLIGRIKGVKDIISVRRT